MNGLSDADALRLSLAEPSRFAVVYERHLVAVPGYLRRSRAARMPSRPRARREARARRGRRPEARSRSGRATSSRLDGAFALTIETNRHASSLTGYDEAGRLIARLDLTGLGQGDFRYCPGVGGCTPWRK